MLIKYRVALILASVVLLVTGIWYVSAGGIKLSFIDSSASVTCSTYTSLSTCEGSKQCEYVNNTCQTPSCGGLLRVSGKTVAAGFEGGCFLASIPTTEGWVYAGHTIDCNATVNDTTKGCAYRPLTNSSTTAGTGGTPTPKPTTTTTVPPVNAGVPPVNNGTNPSPATEIAKQWEIISCVDGDNSTPTSRLGSGNLPSDSLRVDPATHSPSHIDLTLRLKIISFDGFTETITYGETKTASIPDQARFFGNFEYCKSDFLGICTDSDVAPITMGFEGHCNQSYVNANAGYLSDLMVPGFSGDRNAVRAEMSEIIPIIENSVKKYAVNMLSEYMGGDLGVKPPQLIGPYLFTYLPVPVSVRIGDNRYRPGLAWGGPIQGPNDPYPVSISSVVAPSTGAPVTATPPPIAKRANTAALVANKFAITLVPVPTKATFTDVPVESAALGKKSNQEVDASQFAIVEALYKIKAVDACSTTPATGTTPITYRFCPESDITKQVLAKMLVVAGGYQLITPITPTFTDVPKTSAYYSYIETAVALKLLSGTTLTTFGPNGKITGTDLTNILNSIQR